MAVAPAFFLANEFTGYTGQAWREFTEADPLATNFFLPEGTEMGLFMITFGGGDDRPYLVRLQKRAAVGMVSFVGKHHRGIERSPGGRCSDTRHGVIVLIAALLPLGYVTLAIRAGQILRIIL